MKSRMADYQLCIAANQSMHCIGEPTSPGVELDRSLNFASYPKREDFFLRLFFTANLRQLFDCYQPINLNSFNLGQSRLHHLDSLYLSTFNSTFLFSPFIHITKNILVKFYKCTNVQKSYDLLFVSGQRRKKETNRQDFSWINPLPQNDYDVEWIENSSQTLPWTPKSLHFLSISVVVVREKRGRY